MTPEPKSERRVNYPHLLAIPTRWHDVDIYAHVNNVEFYSYFDTVINAYLIHAGGLDTEHGRVVAFAVETHCQFLKPVTFPETVDAALRVVKLGTSSCRYEIGIFRQGDDEPCAVGYFVHVFVERPANRPTPIPEPIRLALERLIVAE
ncbi:MAG: acyl-CoA thioesterase [Chloroflexi bacterium]|jgi:acyl-CoA thioester hydrolase|nr:acyl-CoA thioesterase [Chloroflexota bacterium]MBV6436960.1 hypothetical protein [Anaerolineae bacterium]MDL1916820.1 acyl-CoA thioesterase [Anaerolineae bacterium CFX4]OQY79780.1 MAG: thioesterase [Anaerolineae bacterium UTCFX5]MCC6567017.1 acyl-CoA thioesterase [Chloroflexota bacterium]